VHNQGGMEKGHPTRDAPSLRNALLLTA
jgi:hypothetical protein